MAPYAGGADFESGCRRHEGARPKKYFNGTRPAEADSRYSGPMTVPAGSRKRALPPGVPADHPRGVRPWYRALTAETDGLASDGFKGVPSSDFAEMQL
jgi:hypothetical protein